MALINCPECGKEISDSAKSCPGCGFKIKKKFAVINVRRFLFLPVAILLFGVIFLTARFYITPKDEKQVLEYYNERIEAAKNKNPHIKYGEPKVIAKAVSMSDTPYQLYILHIKLMDDNEITHCIDFLNRSTNTGEIIWDGGTLVLSEKEYEEYKYGLKHNDTIKDLYTVEWLLVK